jgi:hypothetical protein
MISPEMSNAEAVGAARAFFGESHEFTISGPATKGLRDALEYFRNLAMLASQLCDRLEAAEQDAELGRMVDRLPSGAVLANTGDGWLYFHSEGKINISSRAVSDTYTGATAAEALREALKGANP